MTAATINGQSLLLEAVSAGDAATTRLLLSSSPDWEVAKNTHGLNFDARGVRLAELAQAVREGREPRASGAPGLHLCDVMQGLLDSADQGQFFDISSSCDRPAMLPERSETGPNVNLGPGT